MQAVSQGQNLVIAASRRGGGDLFAQPLKRFRCEFTVLSHGMHFQVVQCQ